MSFSAEYLRLASNPGQPVIVRLAPTPSGFLHAGNGVNFILNAALARLHPQGKILLRVDDLDADRKRPEYVQDVFDTLTWLGIEWDEGPRTAEDFELHWSQHQRLDRYQELLQQLRAMDLLFPCNKSRRELEVRGSQYPAEFRQQPLQFDDPDVAWRIKTPDGFPLSDFVVRRRDGLPAYQIASLTDDILFGITHIVRGQDLQDSTRAQQWIASLLKLDNFLNIKFLHHPLIADGQGNKLSKSAGASALKSLRMAGEGPGQVYQAALNLLDINSWASSFSEFIQLLRTHTDY